MLKILQQVSIRPKRTLLSYNTNLKCIKIIRIANSGYATII